MKQPITQRSRLDGPGLISNTGDAALLEIIRRCRRRVRAVLFLRLGAMVVSAILILLAAIVYVWPPPPDVLYICLGVATGVSLTSAAAVAWLRLPGARQTAMELDHRLGLEDCVASALHVQGSSASVAPLIVRDALARLADVTPAQVFPLNGRAPAAFVVVSLTLLLLAVLPERPPAPRATAGGGAAASSTTAPIDPSAPTQDAPSGERPASARPASEQLQPRGTRAPAQVASDERADHTAASFGTRSDEAVSDAARPSASPAEARAPETATRPGERGAGSAPGAGASASASASRGRGGLGAANAPGTGASGVSLAPAANGSGGIRGGSLMSSQGGPVVTDTGQPASAARTGDARRRAEAALARGDVPPNLRTYVRDYFLAIQPPAQE